MTKASELIRKLREYAFIDENEVADLLEAQQKTIEELRGLLVRAQEMAKVMEGMTGCRGDDEWVLGFQDDLSKALASIDKGETE